VDPNEMDGNCWYSPQVLTTNSHLKAVKQDGRGFLSREEEKKNEEYQDRNTIQDKEKKRLGYHL
jgi:hypothetical protein